MPRVVAVESASDMLEGIGSCEAMICREAFDEQRLGLRLESADEAVAPLKLSRATGWRVCRIYRNCWLVDGQG